MNKLTTIKEYINKLGEFEDRVVEVEETVVTHSEKIDDTIQGLSTAVEEIVEYVKTIEKGLDGKDGKDAEVDTKAIAKDVLSQITIPKVDEKAIVKKVIASLPESKSSLKIVKEVLETDPMAIIDKILEMGDKIKFKTSNIDGLDQTISAFKNQLKPGVGYLHGGGDTVAAGTGIVITTNSAGQKVISTAGGGGSVTSVDASGGTTGLTFTGGPITTSGVLTLGGVLGVSNGGTGTTTGYTFSSGLTNTAGTITNNLITGIAGGQTIIGGTAAGDTLNIIGTSGNGTGSTNAITLSVGNNGSIPAVQINNFGGTKVNGLFTTGSTTSALWNIQSIGGALATRSARSQLQFGGSGNVAYYNSFTISDANQTILAGDSYAQNIFGTATITTAFGGDSPLLANVAVKRPTVNLNSTPGSTVGIITSLYVEGPGASIGGSTNYAIYAPNGPSLIDGLVLSGFTQGPVVFGGVGGALDQSNNFSWDDSLSSLMWGTGNTASGNYSTAFGITSTASDTASTAFGNDTIASGYLSTAWGYLSTASGEMSTAFGSSTLAESYASTAFGRNNVGGGSPSSWVSTETLFEIGNGANPGARANALTVLKNGSTGINTATPRASFDVDIDGSIVATGTVTAGLLTMPATGAGTRLVWLPGLSAFRAGSVDGTQWDTASVGDYSTAFGENNTASGAHSMAWGIDTISDGMQTTAWGNSTQASGLNSTAFGNGTVAGGNSSTAWGTNTTAGNSYATAWGNGTTASEAYSTAWGDNTQAAGDYATAFGAGTIADGLASVAMGVSTTASGGAAVAFGGATMALGASSTAWGDTTQAIGDYSTAFGQNSTATGTTSVSFGSGTMADSFLSVVLGRFNVGGGDANSWIGTESVFEIGIGASSGARANALTVLKEGTTIFGGAAQLNGYTVATLPATPVQGMTAYCTDLLAPTYGALAVGGGAVVGKVFFDGTIWTTQ